LKRRLIFAPSAYSTHGEEFKVQSRNFLLGLKV
jgi:hypothetical protein